MPPAPKKNKSSTLNEVLDKSDSSKQTYWFILGREPLLSAAEILARVKAVDFELSPPFLKIKTDCHRLSGTPPAPHLRWPHGGGQPSDLIKTLGGTIKIATELATEVDEQTMIEKITAELATVEGKINFGISFYGSKQQAEAWGKQIKAALKNAWRSVRYVFNNEAILSSVTVAKNGLDKRGREFLINPLFLRTGQGEVKTIPATFSVAKTVAIQPFEEWGKRDYGRPGRDNESGMLPPKLALMMINLATDDARTNVHRPEAGSRCGGDNSPLPERMLLDPFCGSGTILTEAMLLGYKNLIGSDVSGKAVDDTKKNIEWTGNNLRFKILDFRLNIFQSNVADLEKKLSPKSVDIIVTEPYLGKPLRGRETRLELERQANELKNLYLNSFKIFHQLLKPGGKVVCVIPRFLSRNDWVRVDCLKEIKKIGFTPLALLPQHDYLLYHRPGQFVGREIWRFGATVDNNA